MTDKIAIFLTVLASSCLGIYFYYNESETDNKSDEDISLSEIDDITPFIENTDIFVEKKTTKPKKHKKKYISSSTRKKY